MGEARQRREAIDRIATIVTGEAADHGRLLEVGFYAAVDAVGWRDLPPERLREMRLAFMSGAEHVFMSVMNMMDPGDEPTSRDLARMDKLHDEVMSARKELELLTTSAKGRA